VLLESSSAAKLLLIWHCDSLLHPELLRRHSAACVDRLHTDWNWHVPSSLQKHTQLSQIKLVCQFPCVLRIDKHCDN